MCAFFLFIKTYLTDIKLFRCIFLVPFSLHPTPYEMKDPTQTARLNDFLVRELKSIEKGKSLDAGLLSFQYWIGGFLALIDEQGERESFVLRISSELDNEHFTDPTQAIRHCPYACIPMPLHPMSRDTCIQIRKVCY